MEMQDVDMMRKYYSDEAWEAWKHHYKDWPPDEWRALYKDIIAAIGSDPKGPVAPALRPMALDRSGRKSSAGGSHRHDQSMGRSRALARRAEASRGFRADKPGSAVSGREVAGTRRGRNAERRRTQAGRAGCTLTPTPVARWNETIHRVAV